MTRYYGVIVLAKNEVEKKPEIWGTLKFRQEHARRMEASTTGIPLDAYSILENHIHSEDTRTCGVHPGSEV